MTDPFVEWAKEVRLNRVRGPLIVIGWVMTLVGIIAVAVALLWIVWKSGIIGPPPVALRLCISGVISALSGWWLRFFVREGEFWRQL